jgi:hypothetical protein
MTKQQPNKKTISKTKVFFLTLGIILIGLIVFTAVLIYPSYIDIKNHYSQLSQSANQLSQMLSNRDLDFNQELTLIKNANDQVQAIQTDIAPFQGLLKATSKLPWVGKYIAQVNPVIGYSKNILDVIETVVELAAPASDGSIFSNGQSNYVQQLIAAQPKIEVAQNYLLQANHDYSQIKMDLLPEKIRSKLSTMNQIQPYLANGIQLLQAIPEVAGVSKPMTYLIMLQNSDELRPTGVLITAFGLLRIENGVVTVLEFKDTGEQNYMPKEIEAPAPLKQILLAYYWLPRDANWSPSFPESAKEVQNLYYLSTGIKTDGVIGLTQSSIQKMLTFTGPVNIAGQEVNADTAIAYMIKSKMDAINANKTWERKDFIHLLANAMIENISKKPIKEQLFPLYQLIQEMAAQGELLIYANDPSIESLIQQYHLNGGLTPGNGDYVMIVDANLGYNKDDYVVKRSLEYDINLQNPDKPSSTLKTTYSNPLQGTSVCRQGKSGQAAGVAEYVGTSCYIDYFRVLGAKDTQISSYNLPPFSDNFFTDSSPWTHSLGTDTRADGLSEAGDLLVLPPETTEVVNIERILPTSIVNHNDQSNTYQLTIQKQTGISELPVKLSFTLPDGAAIQTETTNIHLTYKNGIWTWQGNLKNSSTEIFITYK